MPRNLRRRIVFHVLKSQPTQSRPLLRLPLPATIFSSRTIATFHDLSSVTEIILLGYISESFSILKMELLAFFC